MKQDKKPIVLQPDRACFRHFSPICELQLPRFTSTAATVSQVDCLVTLLKI